MVYSISGQPTPDPNEPLKEELKDAEAERDKFMYIMYAMIGVIGVLIIGIFFTMFTCKNQTADLEKLLNEQDSDGECSINVFFRQNVSSLVHF